MDLLKTSYNFLNHKEKISLLIIFLIMTISSFLEMVGIGLILPLLTVIVDSSYYYNNEIVMSLKNKLNITSENQFIILIISSIILANLGKALFLTLSAWKQTNDLANINTRFTSKIYSDYLISGWKFLVNKNSATLLRNIDSSAVEYTDKVLISYLTIASEIIMIIFLISFLIFLNPVITLLAIVFCGVIGYLTQRITKNYNYKFGVLRQKYLALRNKHIIETFRIIKLIRILGKVSIFNNKYINLSSKEIKAKSNQQFFGRLPRVWIEFFSILVICLVITFSIKYNNDLILLLPTIGVYVVASYKLLPSVVKILNMIQALRFSKPAVMDLNQEINEMKKTNQELKFINFKKPPKENFKIKFVNNLQIKDLYFSHNSKKNHIFKNFNYKIYKNKILGVVGESGSGKSTLVDLLTGITEPQSGKILIDGKEDISNFPKLWQNTIGYVPQETYLLDDTIKNNIAFGVPDEKINIEKINGIINSLGLKEMIDQLSSGINSNVGDNGVKISGGQKQRIGIARALYISPQIMILDEATSALDLNNEEKILKLISKFKEEVTIIIISHRQSIHLFCDEILNLDKLN